MESQFFFTNEADALRLDRIRQISERKSNICMCFSLFIVWLLVLLLLLQRLLLCHT